MLTNAFVQVLCNEKYQGKGKNTSTYDMPKVKIKSQAVKSKHIKGSLLVLTMGQRPQSVKCRAPILDFICETTKPMMFSTLEYTSKAPSPLLSGCYHLQLLAIEFVTFVIEFVTLAIKFLAQAIDEFVAFAIEFIAMARKFILAEITGQPTSFSQGESFSPWRVNT